MTMTTESTPTLDTWLSRQGACSDARAWAAAYPDTREGRQRAWDECPRGDWMLWIGGKLSGEPGSPARRLLVRAAVACARTVLDKIPSEARAEIASVLDALDAYALDPTAQADLTALRRRAWAVQSKLRAAAAAAAEAAADAADAAADAAAYAAANAANAADATRQAHLARCAQLVRELMPQPPG